MPEVARTRLTYRLELQRAVSSGILESAGSTFLLLIALRRFDAGATGKALVASGGSLGLMLAPIVVSQVARRGWPAAQAASRLALIGTAMFGCMALVPWLPLYVLGSLVTMASASSAIPLMTQIYQENYPEARRGKLFSHAVMVRIGTVAAFSHLAGQFLAADIHRSRWLLWVLAAAFGFTADRLRRYPSSALSDEGGSHPFRAMRFVREDRLFRYTLICWMLMGFANLMMLPMRVVYLDHLGLPVDQIALLTGVIPNVARLIMSQVWGRLFDRMNFFLLRVTLNLGFAAGILTFFLSASPAGLIAGAIIFGVSNAGGDVAWGLWVTKFAAPERTADYMSVHTFFTGLRGVLAPLLAFHLTQAGFSLPVLGWISTGLIVLASAMLLPETRFGRGLRRGRPLAEPVSE